HETSNHAAFSCTVLTVWLPTRTTGNQNHMKNRKALAERIADGIRNGDERRWGTLDDLWRLYGLTRSTGYYLIAEGKIKSRLVRFAHSRGTGRRLIDMRTVERFLQSCPTSPAKNISRRMRNAALRSAAARSGKGGHR